MICATLSGTSERAFGADVQVFKGDARSRLPMVLLAPNAIAPDLSPLDLVRIFGASIEKRTRFAIDTIDSAGINDCNANVRCLADRAQTRGKNEATLLVILTLVVQPQVPDLLTIGLLDLDIVRRLEAEGDVDLDRRLEKTAVVFRGPQIPIDKIETTQTALEKFVAGEFGARLAKYPGGGGFGSIDVDSPIPGSKIELDGQPLGKINGTRARIIDVRPGQRELHFITPSEQESRTILTVEPGREAKVTAKF